MEENGGTGASSTGKSLLEALHEAGGGEEAWEAQNKITESLRGARSSLGTLSVSALSPCAVIAGGEPRRSARRRKGATGVRIWASAWSRQLVPYK